MIGKLKKLVGRAGGKGSGESPKGTPQGDYWIDLPMKAAAIEAVQGDSVWLRPQMGREMVRIRLSDGAQTARIELPTPITGSGRHSGILGQRLVVGGACFDTETGRRIWDHQGGEVTGHTDDAFVCSTKAGYGARLTILRAQDGKVLRQAEAPQSFNWIKPRFVLVGGNALIVNDTHVIGIEVGSGRVMWSTPTGGHSQPLVQVDDTVLLSQSKNDRTGRIMRWSAINPASGTLTAAFVTPGWTYGAALGGELLTLHSVADHGQASVTAFGKDGVPSARVDVSACAYASASNLSAVAQPNAISIFALGTQGIGLTRMPTPEGRVQDVNITGDAVCVLHESRLFVLLLAGLGLSRGAEVVEHDAAYAPLFPAGNQKAWPEPASVLFAGQSLVMLEHPELGRVKLELAAGDPPLSTGEKVYFDDATREAPGLVTVRAWHRSGETAKTVRQEPISLTSAALPPRLVEKPCEEAGPNSVEALNAVKQAVDFEIDPVLARFAEAFAADAKLRDWVDQYGFQFSPLAESEAWQGSDPCLLSLAWDGGGNIYSFYYYPPAFRPGSRLPIVEWDHETNEVEWLAPDFETFLSGFLADWQDDQPELTELIGSRLQVKPEKRAGYRADAPDWFSEAHAEGGGKANLDLAAKVLKTDPQKAERMLVRLYRSGHEDEPRLYKLLEKAYSALNWPLHLENLRTTRDG